MKSLYFLLTLVLTLNSLYATHIVGGELGLVHVKDEQYDLQLKLYFDEIHGNEGAKDEWVTLSVFRKKDNLLMEAFNLPKTSEKLASNMNPLCASYHSQTSLLKYNRVIQLSSLIYTDPEGYYISWERCCRNHSISNIQTPGDVGSTFYMEFPAVSVNRNSFINSSPVFKDLINIYGCKDEPLSMDFGATDADRDSLVYQMVTPMKGHSSSDPPELIAPEFLPAPYDSVAWIQGFDLNNQIPGTVPLTINSSTGEITVTPSTEGLFVFGVVCKEYRNGGKIGEVRRDYQVLIENCLPEFAPEISLMLQNGNRYFNEDTLVIKLNDNACFDLSIADSSYAKTNIEEIINISGSSDYQNLLLNTTINYNRINEQNGIISGNICAKAICRSENANPDQVYKHYIIASDNTCPASLKDSLAINLKIEYPRNNLPQIFYEGSENIPVTIGQPTRLLVKGYDTDLDKLKLDASLERAEFEDLKMNFKTYESSDSIVGELTWTPDCQNITRDSYRVNFTLEDNYCLKSGKDTLSVLYTFNAYDPFPHVNVVNLITPNGDGLNDSFSVAVLPEDNCNYQFQNVQIYNRWGSRVFESESRDFIWDAKNESEGVYYYSINFKSENVKGWIQVTR